MENQIYENYLAGVCEKKELYESMDVLEEGFVSDFADKVKKVPKITKEFVARLNKVNKAIAKEAMPIVKELPATVGKSVARTLLALVLSYVYVGVKIGYASEKIRRETRDSLVKKFSTSLSVPGQSNLLNKIMTSPSKFKISTLFKAAVSSPSDWQRLAKLDKVMLRIGHLAKAST